MKRALAKRTIRLATWIVILSIIGLVLTSFLPWISIEENDSVKETLQFNKAMMDKSDNEQIRSLSNDLNLINILFWLLTILGLVFIIGMIIYATQTYLSLALIMMLIGLGNLIVSALILVLQIFFIKNVDENTAISISCIIPPIKYAYIPLFFNIVLMLMAIVYTKVAVVPLIMIFKQSIKKRKTSKPVKKKAKQMPKKTVKTVEKKSHTLARPQHHVLEKTPVIPVTNKKRDEVSDWLAGEIQKMDGESAEEKPVEEETKQEEKQIEKTHPELTTIPEEEQHKPKAEEDFEKQLLKSLFWTNRQKLMKKTN